VALINICVIQCAALVKIVT